ncbi:MAG: FAD:protein FMN transferase [Proteobacteria bacterium]|nr:FAD:protein FMN transferase [Pseudomonadota bacterium]
MKSLWSTTFSAMGTECALYLSAGSHRHAEEIAAASIAEVLRIEAKYSRYRSDSTLSEINRAAARGGSIPVDEETGALLDYAFACHRQSGGLFDITSGLLRRAWNFDAGRLPESPAFLAMLPLIGLDKLHWQRPSLKFNLPGMEIDFGGIGKEYAADRVAEHCEASGIAYGLVDLGGDIRLIGRSADGSPWPIRIRDPLEPATAFATLPIASGALATSGNYARCIVANGRRYCHLLNPTTGWPAQGLSSVTVAAPRCLLAGSISTIAMLKGREGIGWLASTGMPHLWIDDQGKSGGDLLSSSDQDP